MTSVEKLVRSALGRDCETFEFKVGRNIGKGWRKYVLWKSDGSDDGGELKLVENSWRELHKNDIKLFVGPSVFKVGPNTYADSWGRVEFDPEDGPPPLDGSKAPPCYSQVFALPGFKVTDIVEFCDVGSHGNKSWVDVRKCLIKVMKIAPFAIQYANSAALGATFLEPVDERKAKKIGALIMGVNCEAMDLAEEGLQSLGIPIPMDPETSDFPDYDATMTKYITASGKFRMWWD